MMKERIVRVFAVCSVVGLVGHGCSGFQVAPVPHSFGHVRQDLQPCVFGERCVTGKRTALFMKDAFKNGYESRDESRLTLKMSDVAAATDAVEPFPEDMKKLNPLQEMSQDPKKFNAFINISAIATIVMAVLYKFVTVDQGLMGGWTLAEMAYRISVDNWMSYTAVLETSPLATKAVTSATVYTIGDIIAQLTEGKGMGELDRMRTLRSLLAGLIGHGPMSHIWYDWSEGLFNDVLHITAWWSFFPKVMLDQTLWGPLWNNTYILLLGLMKRDKMETIWGDVKRTTIPLLISGLKLWPLAHCVTYGLIPVQNRLLWVDIVEILWVTILATQASGQGHGHGSHIQEEASVPLEEEEEGLVEQMSLVETR